MKTVTTASSGTFMELWPLHSSIFAMGNWGNLTRSMMSLFLKEPGSTIPLARFQDCYKGLFWTPRLLNQDISFRPQKQLLEWEIAVEVAKLYEERGDSSMSIPDAYYRFIMAHPLWSLKMIMEPNKQQIRTMMLIFCTDTVTKHFHQQIGCAIPRYIPKTKTAKFDIKYKMTPKWHHQKWKTGSVSIWIEVTMTNPKYAIQLKKNWESRFLEDCEINHYQWRILPLWIQRNLNTKEGKKKLNERFDKIMFKH